MPTFGWDLPYRSRRSPLLADNVVATSQPLAAQAGLGMLRGGGNAVDAALAAAITLTVVEPTGNGLGSDAFALVWDGRALHGLNASGRSPAGLDPERFLGRESMPLWGWDAVTVPGAVSAWTALSQRFGAVDFAALFEPAVSYAAGGFPVSPLVAAAWATEAAARRDQPEVAAAFLPGGRPPRPGQRFALPDQARTLRAIAGSHGERFYRGDLAGRIAAHAAASGAALSAEDLAAHRADWVRPLALGYRGVTVHELPPNGQGLAALIALGILQRLPAGHPVDSADALHARIEATKLGLADVYRHVADPAAMQSTPEALLDGRYLSQRAAIVDPARAAAPGHGVARRGGTVYLAAADADGMMVSFIQSSFHGFGAGVVVPGTGISLSNRGAGFSTVPGHPNQVAPGKRPFHTIMPGFVTVGQRALCAFGVMGGALQPQGHVQVLTRVVDHGQNPQAAVDAPRWRLEGGLDVAFEPGHDPAVVAELAGRGHRVVPARGMGGFGGAQMVWRLDGGWLAASDPRKDGHAVGF